MDRALVPMAIYIVSFVEWALMLGHARYSLCRPVLHVLGKQLLDFLKSL